MEIHEFINIVQKLCSNFGIDVNTSGNSYNDAVDVNFRYRNSVMMGLCSFESATVYMEDLEYKPDEVLTDIIHKLAKVSNNLALNSITTFIDKISEICTKNGLAVKFNVELNYNNYYPQNIQTIVFMRDGDFCCTKKVYTTHISTLSPWYGLYEKILRELADKIITDFNIRKEEETMNPRSQISYLYGIGVNINTSHSNKPLKIERVIFNDPATIVMWSDGSKSVVKCGERDIYDPEKGLAMAIAKKFLGNKGNYFEEFKKWLPEEEPTVGVLIVDDVEKFIRDQDAIDAALRALGK